MTSFIRKHKTLFFILAFSFLLLSSSCLNNATVLTLCIRAQYWAINTSESASFPTRFSTWDFSGKHCQLVMSQWEFFWKTPYIWNIKNNRWALCRWGPRSHYLPKGYLTKKVVNCPGGGEITPSLPPVLASGSLQASQDWTLTYSRESEKYLQGWIWNPAFSYRKRTEVAIKEL